MAMSTKTKIGLAVAGSALATVLVTYVAAKRKIRRRCQTQVKRELGKIPVLSDDYIEAQAKEVCDV